MTKTLYTTTRQTLVERVPVKTERPMAEIRAIADYKRQLASAARAERRKAKAALLAEAAEREAVASYQQPVEDQKIERVLLESESGCWQWPESSGEVLTVIRAPRRVAETLRQVYEAFPLV